MKHAILLAFLAVVFLTSGATILPSRQLTVLVVNSEGNPVEGATVFALFDNGFHRDPRAAEPATAQTDAEGKATLTGRTPFPVDVTVTKDGFYDSKLEVPFETYDYAKQKSVDFSKREVSMELKKVIRPIPLYAKRMAVEFPVIGEPLGLDLEKADWVKPHGKGERADLLLRAEGVFESRENYHLEIALDFPHRKDGYTSFEKDRVSDLASAHSAPDGEYTHASLNWERGTGNYPPQQSNGYYLRLRSIEDSSGKIINANFAKIYEVEFGGGLGSNPPQPWFRMTYYFNPLENDRNLEFNPKENLFQKLDHDERVYQP